MSPNRNDLGTCALESHRYLEPGNVELCSLALYGEIVVVRKFLLSKINRRNDAKFSRFVKKFMGKRQSKSIPFYFSTFTSSF